MPSYLDFNSTKTFRDFILGKTLQPPNGPRSFTSSNYVLKNLSDLSNVNPGAVDTNRTRDLTAAKTSNIFKPNEYFIKENLVNLPRRANLNLYPYFTAENHNLISIISNDTYNTESELFKFASNYISKDRNGPVQSRIASNLDRSINGRVRILDALNGNTATALNIVTGREPLIESNNKITVASTLLGKGIDFLQTVSGTQLPFSEIPGDYLSNPANPVNYRPEPNTELGKIWQDATGVLGSLIGIQRRPKLSRKPSDLLIEYMGAGQKNRLFDTLTFNKYAPNYTTSARSQQSSKIFSFVDKIGQGVRSLLGTEAPRGIAYIGDDRANDVKFAMGDFNDNQVRSSYYLSLMFDETAAKLFHRSKNVSEGGSIGGNLTWYSSNSRNKLGEGNAEYSSKEQTIFEETLSTRFTFREDSILGKTQQLLNTMPGNGSEMRSHVANVIDQTSRVFKDGDTMISRGSAVKYTDKFTGTESGVEYCRVWTKDRSYMNYSDTMKRTNMIRKFDGSVMGGGSRVWNLNIAPMSNGRKSFDGSTNIFQSGNSFVAKKYMLSIENLAWKSSTIPGFTVQDLPACERGPNGGRVMWFPPYDLKVSEQNQARWESNSFLGRPEPIYTYQNTERTGQLGFKVVVDHPSVLNLLVREHFKGMSDEEADNYINAFFAGCQDIDFYDLVKKYTNLDSDDIRRIQDYFNDSKDITTIQKYKYQFDEVEQTKPNTGEKPTGDDNTPEPFDVSFFFYNDIPTGDVITASKYTTIYNDYITMTTYSANTYNKLVQLLDPAYSGNTNYTKDVKTIFGVERNTINASNSGTTVNKQVERITNGFTKLTENFNKYNTNLTKLKTGISGGTIANAEFTILGTASEVANDDYNLELGVRRTYSIVSDILSKIEKDGTNFSIDKGWPSKSEISGKKDGGWGYKFTIPFKDLGYENNKGTLILNVKSQGENISNLKGVDPNGNLDCKTVINTTFGLKIYAPNAFYCRQVGVKFKVSTVPTQPGEQQTIKIPKITTVPDGDPIRVIRPKPTIDTMKRIIMKTLSECYYFKKLEDDSPLVFSSLKEKLKYFHPAFHSTTPEGLNARLTFLQQCVRPGNTIPIKGVSDENDLNARNTSFGPPPICVLRVGDFYHSKIIIRDVNITFEDSTWDLNPEGIGVQPMLANVQLQISFIGGQGLERPVERLQNALSSNFYANTEIYDERAQSTATSISGKTYDDFTKEFLEDLQKKPEYILNSDNENKPTVSQGDYIGEFTKSASGLGDIAYLNLIDSVYKNSEEYLTKFQLAYNDIVKKYGTKIGSVFLLPTYRTTTGLTINTVSGNTSTQTIELLGVYPVSTDLSYYARTLKTQMSSFIDSNDMTTLLKLNDAMLPEEVENSNISLRVTLKDILNETIDGFTENSALIELESSRNKLITTFDKVNFIVENQGDGMISGTTFNLATLSGLTSSDFYGTYSSVVTYIQNNHTKLTESLDTSVNFNSLTLTNNLVSDFLSVLLQGRITTITDMYASTINETTAQKAYDILNDFIETPSEKKFKLSKPPALKNDKGINYTISSVDYITDDTVKTKLMNIKNNGKVNLIGTTLNYYKP